jgi:mRNA interferase MazF
MPDAKRGEIWLVDLGYVAKVRPCLVVSVDPDPTDRDLVTLVPHTTSTRKSRFEAIVPVPFLREGAFSAQSLVTVPRVKLIRRLGLLAEAQMLLVDRVVASWLGLPGGGS